MELATETIWIITFTVLAIFLTFIVVPKLWKEIAIAIAGSSPDAVIRDMSSLITISGAAPYKIDITYKVPSEKYSYNLNIKGRVLTLEMLAETGSSEVKKQATDEIPIDPQNSISDTREFLIQKTRNNGINVYEVDPK